MGCSRFVIVSIGMREACLSRVRLGYGIENWTEKELVQSEKFVLMPICFCFVAGSANLWQNV